MLGKCVISNLDSDIAMGVCPCEGWLPSALLDRGEDMKDLECPFYAGHSFGCRILSIT